MAPRGVALVVLMAMISATAVPGVRASSVPAAISAPLFLWSSERYLPGRTSYQVVHGLHDTLQRVVSSALDPSTQAFLSDWLDQGVLSQRQPQVVLLVLGSQVQSSDLHTMPEQLQPLKEMLQAAGSSLAVPHVMHELTHISTANKQEVAGLAAPGMVVGCGAEQQSLGAALERLGDAPGVVVVCTSVAAGIAGTPEGAAAELQQVQEAADAVAALGKPHLSVYAVQPDGARLQQRRRLQASNSAVGTCGALCQTQVKWLEGILAALILALAAFSGMCCLYMLDTPTRFEKPKEGSRSD